MLSEEAKQSLQTLRRDIHMHPETGFDVQRTAALAAEEMRSLGLSVRTEVGQTGVLADLIIPGATHCIALRADMDALPMQEESTHSYRSTVDGKAHMCGHDAHTAMLIGAARLLVEQKDILKSNIRFIFQPHEEGMPGGAPAMIADGALEGVDEIYALHVWPWMDVGRIGICRGPAMAQADAFSIRITGKGGHAAAPQHCIDPLPIGCQLVTALQTIVSRKVDPLQSAVLSVTQIHAGSTHNVISSRCDLGGTVRTYDKAVQAEIETQIHKMSQELVESFGATVEVVYEPGFPPVINHPQACDRAAAAAAELQCTDPAERAMFGEDFAYYAEKLPGCFIQLGCRNETARIVHPLHHPRFDIDESCLAHGAELLARIAMS